MSEIEKLNLKINELEIRLNEKETYIKLLKRKLNLD